MVEETRRVFEYEGPFYARPVYRGIHLGDVDDPGPDKDLETMVYDLIGGAYSDGSGASGTIRVKVEVLSIDPDRWSARQA